jgi:acyl-CoA reductase-like NAD-dependent aldehyde dehydrogenase
MTPQAQTFEVINPATGEICGTAPDCGPADLDRAVKLARTAQPAWAIDEAARRDALARAAVVLAGAAEEIAPILTAEHGRPVSQAAHEVVGAGVWLDYFATVEVGPTVIQDDEAANVEVLRRPLGVVAAITPWNYPLLLACWKIAPALRAGNAVILKPSPYTPLSTLAMASVLASALPEGVLNVVTGGDELGARMVQHPDVNKVSFTGSIEAGLQVASRAASDLKRVTLELGGNDAAIVLDDADPAAIAPRVFEAAFMNNGQVCSAIKRVYAPESLHDDLVSALAECARAARVGDPMDAETTLGPINNRAQFERVQALVSDAIARGGEAVAGGAALEAPGYFFAPTVITGVAEGTPLVDQEQFGPALPVMSYRSVDEALQRANRTHFGLSGSVWSADVERAASVASRLECGTAWANAHLALAPHQPFGGFKWSGIGTENGPWGLESFSQMQVLYRARG